MDLIKKTITARLLNKLPKDTAFIEPQWLNGYDIPEFIVERIKFELHRNLENSIVPPKTDWADMNAVPVKEAWYQFIEAIEAETRLPMSSAGSVMESAVGDILDLLVEPRKNLPDYLFGKDRTLDFRQASERVRTIVVYTHFGLHLPNYMQRKQIDIIDRERFSSFINQLDDKLTSRYSPLNWAHLLSPLFELTNHLLDPELIARFFRDKEREDLARRFDNINDKINQTRFIEILTSADFDPQTGSDQIKKTGTVSKVQSKQESKPVAKPLTDPEPLFISETGLEQEPVAKPVSKPVIDPEPLPVPEPEPVQEPEPEPEPEPASEMSREPETKQNEVTEPVKSQEAGIKRKYEQVEVPDPAQKEHEQQPVTKQQFSPKGKSTGIDLPESVAETGAQPATLSATTPESDTSKPLWEKFKNDETEPDIHEKAGSDEKIPDPERSEPDDDQDGEIPLLARFQTRDKDRGDRPADQNSHKDPTTSLSGDDKTGEHLPMWKRFVTAATGGKMPDSVAYDEDRSIADFFSSSKEDSEPDIEISNPLRIDELTKTLDNKKKYYIKRFFRGDHAAFNTVIRDLSEMDSWNEAGPYITRNVFKKNNIDPYSDEAVNFIDRLQSYFTAQK